MHLFFQKLELRHIIMQLTHDLYVSCLLLQTPYHNALAQGMHIMQELQSTHFMTSASHNVVCSTANAQDAATQIWSIYLGGTSSTRPFGTSVLDGVDLDIEASTGSQYYAAFVDQLQSLWGGASKKYYLTAVPQCKLC